MIEDQLRLETDKWLERAKDERKEIIRIGMSQKRRLIIGQEKPIRESNAVTLR